MDNENESNNNTQQNELTEEEKELLEAKKAKIRLQISQLEDLIEEMTLQSEIVKFGDLDIDPSTLAASTVPESSSKNIDDELEYELFKLSGLYCAKCTNNEFVYNFSPTSNYECPYAVQFFLDDNKITLGKWALPWGIKIEHILKETPLEKPSQVSAFLRNCKRHVNCHDARRQQVETLKKSTSTVKNIRVEGSLGYLYIYIDLLLVNNNELDRKHNLGINIFYESGEVRPHLIKVNTNLDKEPSEDLLLKMTRFAKGFKRHSLEEAYQMIAEKDHPVFVWKPEENNENNQDFADLGLDDSAISDEESEEEVQQPGKRKRAKKRVIKKGNNSGKNQVTENSGGKDSFENSENETAVENNEISKNKVTKKKVSVGTKPGRGKKSPSVNKTTRPTVTKSPGGKSIKNQPDKRQTRLSFKGVPLDSSDARISPRRQEFNQRKRDTSTPKLNRLNRVPIVPLTPISISSIEANSDEINRSKADGNQKREKKAAKRQKKK
ncbi:uncharacterized protein LOC130674877 [Microplitis mediator]|uniref:uncharacterized protein LOC130674877 n=1 Tax=Microplitis mediator TaxID=375433 RepID=UPI002555E5C9|nr:uncharacterized protein LOC130674877 [Microplitis mediator]